MDLTKTFHLDDFEPERDFEARVASTDYYLVAGGRDEDRVLPLRVSRNDAGHPIAYEIPDATGALFVSNEKGFTAVSEGRWLCKTDEAGYDAALKKIRAEARDKVVTLQPRPI